MGNSRQQKQIGRYDQIAGVRIDESRIPLALRPVLPFARMWAILSDDALERAIQEASREEILKVVEAAGPLKAAIHDFAYRSAGASATPVPDEVVLFHMFAWSLNRLEVEHAANKQ